MPSAEAGGREAVETTRLGRVMPGSGELERSDPQKPNEHGTGGRGYASR